MSALRKVNQEDGLLDVERARNILSRCLTIDDAKKFKTLAEHVANEQRKRKAGEEAETNATEIVTRAERRLGELLAELPKASGGKPYQSVTSTKKVEVKAPSVTSTKKVEVKAERPQTITELGFSHNESSRLQKLAAVPEKTFEKLVVELKNDGKRPTASIVVRAAAGPRVTTDPEPEYRDEFDAEGQAAAAYRMLRKIVDGWPADQSAGPLLSALRQVVKELEKRG